MVPMIELHDETGSNDINGPTRLAQYYVDDLLEVLQDFEPNLLVNIANEWGDYFSSAESWLQAYRPAISVLRDAGINHTLVIDANDYGQRGQTIVEDGQATLDFDPQHKILFSTHMYQAYENPQVILDVIRGAQNARSPLIVGEFGYQHGERNGQPIPVPYEVMLEAARVGVGYPPRPPPAPTNRPPHRQPGTFTRDGNPSWARGVAERECASRRLEPHDAIYAMRACRCAAAPAACAQN